MTPSHAGQGRMQRSVFAVLVCTAAVALAGCPDTRTASTTCKTTADCTGGKQCIAGVCVEAGELTCSLSQPCPGSMYCCGGICSRTLCCWQDRDCGDGAYCNNGRCAEGSRGLCSETEPCTSGRCLLSEGRCVECLHADDCLVDSVICSAENSCRPTGCSTAGCWAEGKVCDPTTGDCRDCISLSECGERVCNNGTCRPCTASDSCGLGRECVVGACVNSEETPCTSNADCGELFCSLASHRCEPCILPSDCGSGRTCADGTCHAESTAECQDDSGCNPPATVCQAELCAPGCTPASCSPGQVCSPMTGRCVVSSTGALALGADCQAHDDCVSGVCWQVDDNGTNVGVCSRACVRHDDCPAGFTCYELGDGNLCASKALFPGAPLDVPPGGACSGTFVNSSCMTGYCNTTRGQCMQMCGRNADCADLSSEYVCVSRWAVGTDINGDLALSPEEIDGFTQLCHPPYGALLDGDLCYTHDGCRSGYCVRYPDLTMPETCGRPCCTPGDCGPGAPVCKPLDVWDGIRDSEQEPYGYQKVCLDREYAGGKAAGELCSADSECRSELCVAGPSGQKRCTHTCCTHDDCAYDWAESCRPPFAGPGPSTDANFQEVWLSLGRRGDNLNTTFPVGALTTLCMPR